jgi:hypothetical protein
MSRGQFIENIKNIFQKRAQPRGAEISPAVKEAEPEQEPASDPGIIAAIAAALCLSGRAEIKTASGAEVAAAIAAALHLHLSGAVEPCAAGGKIYDNTPWCQYGREQIQSARFRVFNRPVIR